MRRTDDPQSDHARLHQKFAAARKGHDQLFAQAGHAIQQGPELAGGNAEHPRGAPRQGSHDDRTTGEKVDVAGELARLMNHDYPPAVRRVLDLDLTAFNNHQIDIRLAGPKDGLAIGVIACYRQRLDERNFDAGQSGKRHILNRSHG